MSSELVKQLNRLIQQSPHPKSKEITPEAFRVYEAGNKIINTYRGDPTVLVEALQAYLSTGTRPYVYAGFAKVLSLGAFEHDDVHDKEGLEQSIKWLRKAQQLAPNRPEIDIVEVGLHMKMKRVGEARKVLDKLSKRGQVFFDIALAEMHYWEVQDDLKKVQHWYKTALQHAKSEDDRLYLLNVLAGMFMMKKMYPQALEGYNRVLQIDENDPWAWHNASVILYRMERYVEAFEYNGRALELMDFGVARNIEQLIKKKMGL